MAGRDRGGAVALAMVQLLARGLTMPLRVPAAVGKERRELIANEPRAPRT